MTNCYFEFSSYMDYWYDHKETFNNLNSWCKENCNGYYILDILGSRIRAGFVENEDAVAFKLRWL